MARTYRFAPPRRQLDGLPGWFVPLILFAFAAALLGMHALPAAFRSTADPDAARVAFALPQATAPVAPPTDVFAARFGRCHAGGGRNCVVDGDTFWFGGDKYRIADIDTPETHPARCATEARLGKSATDRLQALLSAGSFSLAPIDRDTDRYGRKLRVVMRGGESIGETLVAEGLARRYAGGYRESWC